MMTKKDYVRFAAIVKNLRQPFATEEDEVLDNVAYLLADMFVKDNPRFDRQRFLEAAGVQNEHVPSTLSK